MLRLYGRGILSTAHCSTGLFVTEALHPYNVFRKAGFEVELVSETGSYRADWLSQQKEWLSAADREDWDNEKSGFRTQLDKHLKPSDIDPSEASTEELKSLCRD